MRKFSTILAMMFAAPVLGQGTNPKDLPSAIQYLQSDRPSDRAFALSVMGLLGGDAVSASKQVVQSYFDGSPQVRQAASLALQNVNPTLYGPVETLTANNPANPDLYGNQLQALQTLSNLGTAGDAALPALLAFMPRMAPADQTKMVGTVAKVGANDPQVRQLLANWALTSANPAVREAAMKELPKVNNAGAETGLFLAALQREKDPKRRIQLMDTLAGIGRGNSQALTALQGYQADANPDVRKAAKAAVAKLQGKEK